MVIPESRASLTLNADGNPIIAYGTTEMSYYRHSTSLMLAAWTGKAWEINEIVSQAPVYPEDTFASLALDSTGAPILLSAQETQVALYHCRLRIVRARIDRLRPSIFLAIPPAVSHSRWILPASRTPATGSPAGCTTRSGQTTPGRCQVADPAFDTGEYSALALDRVGLPHISYYDATHKALEYAHWTGNTWINQVVDQGGNVGWYTSLALDSAGQPHISYYEAGNGDLRYPRWTGVAWITETVDSAGKVGQYTSLALDSADRPHISYYDVTASALK